MGLRRNRGREAKPKRTSCVENCVFPAYKKIREIALRLLDKRFEK